MYVRPKIFRQQAENILSAQKSSFSSIHKFLSRRIPASPEKLEVVYLPFFVFDVLVEKEIKSQKDAISPGKVVTLSVDGLLGHAVLYTEEALEMENDPETPGQTCDFELPSSVASNLALGQYKGILLEHGLRTRSYPRAREISEGKKIYYPFWVGYYKKKKGYDFKAVDAVSGEIQGIRMRRVFIRALKNLERQG